MNMKKGRKGSFLPLSISSSSQNDIMTLSRATEIVCVMHVTVNADVNERSAIY